jgi:hypothetical protein
VDVNKKDYKPFSLILPSVIVSLHILFQAFQDTNLILSNGLELQLKQLVFLVK